MQGHDKGGGDVAVEPATAEEGGPAAAARRKSWPRRALEGIAEFVGEVVFEALLTGLALLVLGGLALLVLWGWSRSPWLTGSLVAVVVAFLGYGAYEILGPGRRRRGRLAGAAVVSVVVLLVLLAYYPWG